MRIRFRTSNKKCLNRLFGIWFWFELVWAAQRRLNGYVYNGRNVCYRPDYIHSPVWTVREKVSSAS